MSAAACAKARKCLQLLIAAAQDDLDNLDDMTVKQRDCLIDRSDSYLHDSVLISEQVAELELKHSKQNQSTGLR